MEDKKGAYFLVAVFALSLRSVSGGCEQNALGLADGYILDSQLTASSVLNSNTPAKHGRLNYTAGSSWCASTTDSNPYLQVNLQTLYIICAVSTQGNSQADQWVKNYTLESSTDGVTWTDYKEDGQTKVFLGNFGANSTAKRALFRELSTKYLRVVAWDNDGGVCMRIELYGHHIQGNIALFMPTSQSTTLGTAIASKAVDGVKNSHHSYCTHTQGGSGSTNPWWRVDLGRVQPVSFVRILNRGDCCADRLDGAEIRVGNDTANGGASNHRCANITQIPAGKQRNYGCTPTAHGRYVSIRIPGNSKVLTVCEVEVYSFLTGNLAFNQPTEQISTGAGGAASRAVDGNNSPVWADNSCTHTTTTTDPWWRVDLGFSVAVGEVRIFNRACDGDCGSRLSSFKIWIGNVRENNGGTSNNQCGNLHSIANGKSKSIYCVPRIMGRYVYIRIPDNNKVLTLCEVEVYSRRRVDGNACNNQPVGLEDSSKIPDYRFTASSNGVNKSPSSGRLKGSVAWVPSTTNADDFLQIDLGSVYAVCSVATQGSPNADNWTTTYKIKTSLNNSNWTTYAENNADKVFDGNNDKISIIRNDLRPTFAKFIRFYPMAFSGHRALRVEVYGSPEGCQSPLGLEDRRIQYSQISASSKVDPNHAANFSRLYSSSSWCSSAASSSEYLQVDLGETTAITGIATQGDPSVDKWVTRYMIQFGAHSYTRLFRYLSFQGNRNRNLPYVNWFSEPVETSVVRIVPLSWKTSVCLRLELYGCGLLLKVPKPTINNFQDANLQPAKGSFVNLQCNASSGVDGMMIVFRWAKDGNDISTLSSAISTQGKFFLSTLRVNFTKAEDIVSSYNCTRESVVSRTVDCQKTFVCLAFYSSLALRLEPTYQTAVVTVKLRVPDGVKQITVDTIFGTSAVIRWQKLLAGGADEVVIAGYQVWYAKESNSNPANFVNATKNDTLVLDNLTRNTRYMVKVRAISALGFGLWSSTVNFRTARTVTCEEKILGPETGFTPDMVMSSSQYNSNTSSSHSVMSYAVDFPWCASLNDTSPYLEIDLGDVFVICALSTRGDPHGEHWVESYGLETSADGTTWMDYKEEDQQRTFLGNYDSATVVKEEFYSGMLCQKVRLRVKTFHGLPCLKLQLFGVKQSRGNLALNQPTNQTDTGADGVASRAVDGGTSTDYTQSSCTHTTKTTDPWWRVDLGSLVAVAEVRIVNRACDGDCGSRLSAFEIRIGNSTSGGGSSNQLCRNNLQVPSGQTMSFNCDPSIYGRYVYIRIPGNNKVLTLCEVEVYSRKNLALNKQTNQSSTNSGGVSSRAVDGNPSTDWGHGSCTHTTEGRNNPWWRVDLGSSLVVGEVFVVNRDCTSPCGDRLKEFEVWIGNVDDQNGGTSNTKCGILHSLNSGERKSIYCVPRIVGRYVYIRIPGNDKVLTLCEVAVYSRRRVDGNVVCATQPVGADDSFKIPDYRFSASSFKAGNEPSKGRLNGGSAWVPSTNGNNNDFLEIDLGSVYFICGVVTQGNFIADEWTTEFKIKTSLNSKNWTTYGENGIEKVFAGNTDRSSLRRNSLIRAPLAKFIRFYPVTYSASKALRVEIYGYAQGSKTPLGLENGDLTDSQLAASSNPAAVKNGRLYNQSAWCSSAASPTEYFQVDLGNVKTITGVATQGDPSSDRWVETYIVNYSYTGQHWTQFKGVSKQPELFKGNDNRNSVQANWMKQPFVARYLRIFAQTWNSAICLRIDGYGSSLVNAPIIRPPLIDKTLKKTVGNSVILSCVVYGRAHVSVTWMVNDQELTNPSDITSNIVLGNNWEKTESNLTFTYRNANYEKTLFQCTRVSRETRILRCKKLSVTCKANYYGTLLGSSSAASVSLVDNLFLPESPTEPVFSNIKSTSAVVTWNDTDSGDSPILFYRVLYNTSSLSMNQTTLTRSINITSLQPYTDYTFKVQAISAIGDGLVSKAAHLKTYLRASIFLPPPKVYRLTLGQRNVSFVCFGQGYPIPKVVWKKDGNLTVLPAVSSIVSAINSSKRLEISGNGATYQEAGNYTCEVNNGVDGMPVVSSTLEIIFSPEFTITPKDATVIEERSEVFDCRATGIPTPVISWSFNGTGRLPSTSSQLSNGSLLITRVQNNITYEGTYTCRASSRAGESTAEANLTVWVSPQVKTLENRKLLIHSDLKITCLVEGDPFPDIVWMKNGQAIITPSQNPFHNGTLTIDNVDLSSEGSYSCVASNRAGNASSSAFVEILIPLHISVAPSRLLVVRRQQKNSTAYCYGYGKPSPIVTWLRLGVEVPLLGDAKAVNNSRRVFQDVTSRGNGSSQWNASSRLYLAPSGLSYQEAGIYVCKVTNSADRNNTINDTVNLAFFPEVTVSSQIVKEHTNATFQCFASGIPKPHVTWSHNGTVLPTSSEVIQGSNVSVSLKLVNVTNEFEGNYTCSASSVSGVMNKTAELIVDVPPRFITQLANTSILVNTTVNLTCTGIADPDVSIRWLKDDSDNITGAMFTQGNTTLVIDYVTLADEGRYTCEIWNRAGRIASEAYIEITVPPRVSVNQEILRLKRNEKNVTLDCYGSGKPLPVVTWKKGPESLTFGSVITVNESDKVIQVLLNVTEEPWSVVSRLHFGRDVGVTYQEAGNYTCQVSNGIGREGTVNATAEVLFLPEIVKTPSDQIILENDNVTFVCNSTGVPTPSISWEFNSGKLPSSSVAENEMLTVYSVQNNASFEGYYTCTAVNRAGAKNATAKLTVDVPAVVQSPPQNVSSVAGSDLNLTCLVYGDPSPSVLWFREGSRVMSRAEYSNGNKTLIIRGIVVEDEGLFTCVTFNRAGNDSSSVFVEVKAHSQAKVTPTDELKLRKYDKNITLDCHGYGKPTPKITWMRNNTSIPTVNNFTTDYGDKVVQVILAPSEGSPWNVTSRLYLRVSGVTYQDAGIYTCEVFNGVGNNISATDNLQVFFPPIVRPQENASILIYSNLNLTCIVEGHPFPTVHWTKNNALSIPRAQLSADNRTLLIKDVDVAVEGVYTCVAVNRDGNHSASATVEVLIPPKVLVSHGILNLQRNERNVKIDCFGYGKPRPSVAWRKGGYTIPQITLNTANYRDVVVQRVLNTSEDPWNVTSRLYVRLSGVTYQEAGDYTCEVSNGVGSQGSVNATTEILFRPEFVQDPTNQIVKENGNVTFLCHASGVPYPTISWAFNKGQLPPLSRTNVTGALSLFLVKNTAKYEGNYTCMAVSRAGINSSTAILTVDVPATITVPPQNASLINGFNLTMTCLVYGDPLPSVYWVRNGSRVISRAEFSNGNTSLEIRNISIADEGVYTCLTENRAGNDSFSATVEVKAHPRVFIPPPRELNLLKYAKNITADCYGYGKPVPRVRWTRNNKVIDMVNSSTNDSRSRVVQVKIEPRAGSPWNVGSRLYLHLGGVTYKEAGNYTCDVFNGVGGNISAWDTFQVFFIPEFVVVPSNIIAVEDSNATFSCNASGVPDPVITWSFGGGHLPEHVSTTNDLTVIAVRNTAAFEGWYTCNASNLAGHDTRTANLTVDVVPSILSPLENVTLLRGSKLNLTCPADGDPLPSIYWSKNGSPTIPRSHFSQGNSTLVILSVTISDEGLYECTARSRAGNNSSEAHVEVQVKPNVFVSGNKTVILEKGQKDVIVKCFGNGYPAPAARWRKWSNVIPVVLEEEDDSVVQVVSTDIQNPMDNVTSDLYLRIGGVTYNESGNYTCSADNGVGDNPAASSVEVIFKPEFVIKPQSKIVEEGATVFFMCKASGVPQPEVSWSLKNGSLPPHSTDLNGNLTIPSVGNNNTYERTYTCTATSRAGVATIDVVLTVHVPPRIVLALNKSVVAERGDTVRLSCSAVGDPTPRYQWTKDGSPVIPNAVLENNNKTLQLTDVESRNDGIYTCLAVNDAGDVSTSSNVTVHARPSILDRFPNTETIENNVLNLSCTGVSIPAPDVTWYKHNKPVTSGQHILITTTGKSIRITTLSIQRVKYEDRGDYTCSFANYRGSVTRTGSLIVLVPSNISIPPTSVNEKLGLRVSFNCTVRGFPLPTLLWTKDNINLNISNGIEIAQHEDSSKIESFTSLTIIQAKRSDTGVYVCHANNSAGTTSKAANLTVLEKPDKLTTTIDSTTAHTVKLSWTVSFDGNSPVLFYTAAHNISNGTMYYNVSSNESSLVMNLNPATFYEFTITATNQFGTSDPVVISTTTLESVPDAPRFVRAIATASRSISLDWTIPAVTNGKLINYVVYYDTTEDYGDNATVPMNQTLLPNTTSLVIESLVPFTYYTFQVQAFTKVGGGHRSDPTERVRTHEDVPGTPSDITVEKQGEEGFVIRWKKPSEANGIITGYKLYFVVRRNNADDTATVEDRVYVIKDDSTTKLIRVYELNGDKTYDVTVQARTSKGYGQKSTETRTVKTRPIRPPPPPPPQPPNETTTETAVIELAEFSDINGPIVYYQVINLRVPQAEQDNFPTPEEITPNKLVSYEEAHTSNKPVAYVAFGFEGNEFNRHKRFKLGNGQTCCPRKKRDIAKTYYNGPLEPNTIYKAFTRAFTSESEYSQSQYIPIRTKELATPPTPSPPGSVTGIIVGVIVGVLLIVFAAIVFIYIRRKRRTRDDHADENELQSLDRVSERAGRQSFDNEGFKSDIDGNRRPIPVQNLKDYYFRMHEDDNRLFTEEYKSLKITGSPTTQICDRPDNKVRNRYGNIKAYDHSRVILTMGGSSDYINANYIDGYVRPKQYIATIGPKPETVNHFWWMIWQEKTSIIVMLTRPVEQGKVKCHQYWPDSGGEEYGALTVTVKEKLEYSEFEIRTLSLQMPTKPDLEPRIVKHFYFTAWPDHDVPDEATGLLQFWKAVKKCASGIEEPIVVHCSAGVGRTGTFITIDAMMEQISASEELDVYSFVTRMREQRNFMVQRQSQYNFIFYALLEATTFGDTEILSHNLRMKMQKMTTKNPKTGKTSFEREFELLDGVVPQENSDFKSALKSVNTTKNRYANVLPYEKSRVVLPKTSEEEDDTSYINASYIEGYQQKKAYIATQAPLRNTVGDFWRMVWDEEVCCIVMLVTLKEDSEVPFVDYWSEVEATMHGSLSIETTDFDNKENYAVRKINLSDTKTEKVRKVTQYTVSNWPKDGIPSDPMAVVNMIGVVQKIQQQTGNNPIVVHCSDGIGRTGTFCAIVTSLEHIKLEDSVDVFTTVRMLRTQRPGMVQTLEQYKFIYDALMAYLDSFEASLYQNFL